MESEQEYFDYVAKQKKSDELGSLFRICRDLAMASPTGIFPMAGSQATIRLGLDHDKQGTRLITTLCNQCGIIELDALGTSRIKGSKGIASTYRWMIGVKLNTLSQS